MGKEIRRLGEGDGSRKLATQFRLAGQSGEVRSLRGLSSRVSAADMRAALTILNERGYGPEVQNIRRELGI